MEVLRRINGFKVINLFLILLTILLFLCPSASAEGESSLSRYTIDVLDNKNENFVGEPVSIVVIRLRDNEIYSYAKWKIRESPQTLQIYIPQLDSPDHFDELVILVDVKEGYKSENYSFPVSETWTGPTTFKSAAKPFRYEVPENATGKHIFEHTFYLTPTYHLTTSIAPPEGGFISLDPQGGTYTYGTKVSLRAEAKKGYKFENWSGDVSRSENKITVTIEKNEHIIANFKKPQRGRSLPWLMIAGIVGIIVVVILGLFKLYQGYVFSSGS